MLDFDAAAIILAQPVDWDLYPHIRPVCLPPGGHVEHFLNQSAQVSGWGKTDSQLTSRKLRRGQVTVLAPAKCQAVGTCRSFTANMLCAGSADGGGGVTACLGDSGGPLGKGNKFLYERSHTLKITVKIVNPNPQDIFLLLNSPTQLLFPIQYTRME